MNLPTFGEKVTNAAEVIGGRYEVWGPATAIEYGFVGMVGIGWLDGRGEMTGHLLIRWAGSNWDSLWSLKQGIGWDGF